jgi:hypothetical protein
LYTVDVTNGHATLVGAFEGGVEVDAMAIPYTSGPPGPAKVEVWVPLDAEENIAAIVQNLGTFVENDLTAHANIYEYITNESNGTEVFDESIADIDLDEPLGGEEPLNFGEYTFAMEGVYTLIINIPLIPADKDDVPNNNMKKIGIGCDDTPPVSTHTLNPATPNGLNGWYVSDLTVTLKADDGQGTDSWQSGVKEMKYKVADGDIKTISGAQGSFKVENDGEDIPVEYWSYDKVGNEETPHHTFTVDMDQTKPTIGMTYEVTGNGITGYIFTFTATATDEMSGMERVEFYFNDYLQSTVNGSGPTYQWTIEYMPFPNVVVKAIGYDVAGNQNFDEIEDPKPHSNEQSMPNGVLKTKLNLGK